MIKKEISYAELFEKVIRLEEKIQNLEEIKRETLREVRIIGTVGITFVIINILLTLLK